MTMAKLFMHCGSQAMALRAHPPADVEVLIAALDEFESGIDLTREVIEFDERECFAKEQARR